MGPSGEEERVEERMGREKQLGLRRGSLGEREGGIIYGCHGGTKSQLHMAGRDSSCVAAAMTSQSSQLKPFFTASCDYLCFSLFRRPYNFPASPYLFVPVPVAVIA
ncbi:hypothetical protein FRC16_001161 [Serendipita sp. 398]|nr:hypothetical protein FRC16_001161 [Serendipita sp. 398]